MYNRSNCDYTKIHVVFDYWCIYPVVAVASQEKIIHKNICFGPGRTRIHRAGLLYIQYYP